MVATIRQLHPPSPALAGFLRVGHTWQKKLEALDAAGRLPYRRVVFDAAYAANQIGLLERLRASGCEIVLDPNFAEMANRGSLPIVGWPPILGKPGEAVWSPDDFGPKQNSNLARLIAEFAVQIRVKVVLTPAHLLETVDNRWRDIDLSFCEMLRLELDRVGCHGVGQKESFRAGDWKKPAQGGGSKRRVYIAELDRYFYEDQLNAIFSTRGGRPRFGCNDPNCCPHGINDMKENPHAHFYNATLQTARRLIGNSRRTTC